MTLTLADRKKVLMCYLRVGEEEDGVLIGFGRLAQNDLEILVPLVRRVRLADLHLTSHNQSKTYSNDVTHVHCTRTST